jgi:hypothetical protein
MPTFTRSFGPVSAAAVDAAERRLGVNLPADYKRFLYTTNGGCPESNCFVVPERGPALVGILYGIRGERTNCDLEFEQEQVTLWEPLPAGFISIGDDPGGCPLLLATLGADAGQVLFWDRKGFWVREDGRNTFPVAGSFTAFLDLLRDD